MVSAEGIGLQILKRRNLGYGRRVRVMEGKNDDGGDNCGHAVPG